MIPRDTVEISQSASSYWQVHICSTVVRICLQCFIINFYFNVWVSCDEKGRRKQACLANMLLAPRFKQGNLRPAPYFPHSASSRGSLSASTWLTKKRGQELALKWVICLSHVTCPFIQHLLSACHEGAPAEAGLPKARDSSSNSSPSRGEVTCGHWKAGYSVLRKGGQAVVYTQQ